MSTEHNVANLINSHKTNVVFVNNGILVNSFPSPALSNICIHKCGPWTSLYKLCGPWTSLYKLCGEVGQLCLRRTKHCKLHYT
jgi:hypothetical protein